MASFSGNLMKIIGLVLVVAGVGLALWGYQSSTSVGSQVVQAVTGAERDEVMILYIAGAVSGVVGLYLFFRN